MTDAFVGEIRAFAGDFAPKGWAECSGQVMPISQNTALFSLFGAVYGGDGKSTFALPDLNGRAPMHPGEGPGLTARDLGEVGGEAVVAITIDEIPAHRHHMIAADGDANLATPGSASPATAGINQYRQDADTTMSPAALGATGASQPHNNQQPYLGVTFIIALQGTFPPRP